jgi:methanogenic corrinoid protein MtbC1
MPKARVVMDAAVRPAGHQLRDRAEPLAGAAVACTFGRHPAMRVRYGPVGRTQARQDAFLQISCLADALDVASPALFNDHIGWLKVVRAQRGGLGDDLSHHLLCMAEVVRDELLPAVAQPAIAMIEGALDLLPGMPDTTPSALEGDDRFSVLAREYVHRMLGGYRSAGGRLAYEAVERGESVRQLYLHVLQPALREIGRLWQIDKIHVAQEHFCSAATQVVMAQLLTRAEPAERSGHRAVIACIEGELHELGARMVGDFFEMAGWDSYFCGASTPSAACVESVVERAAEVLAISSTMGYHVHAVQELIRAVRADRRCGDVRILVGGHPFSVDPGLWGKVGADGCAADAEAAVALADAWVGSGKPT